MADAPRDERFLDASEIKSPPCIRCNREIANLAVPNLPLEGVVFEAKGQYGSREFDPGDGSYLEINLCDPCLVDVAKTHVISYPQRPYNQHCPD